MLIEYIPPLPISHFLPNSLCLMLKLYVYPSWFRGLRVLLAAHKDSMKFVYVQMGSFMCLWLEQVPRATKTVTFASKSPTIFHGEPALFQ